MTWVQLGNDILSGLPPEFTFDGEIGGNSGHSVSLNSNGDVVAIGAPFYGFNMGNVRVYSWNGSAWIQRGVNIIGEEQGDKFGSSVSLNNSGNVLAIGAPFNSSNGTTTGNVRIYEWNGSSWIQRGDAIYGEFGLDSSGTSISLNSTGDVVVIGAPNNDGNGTNSGHVRVYYWNGSAWIQRGSDINGEAANDGSGFSVDINSDGSIIAIGAIYNDENGNNSGHVRVYSWNGSAWIQRGNDINGGESSENNGYSISLNSSGDILVIGAPYNGANGVNSGLVRVYSWNGLDWIQLGSDISGTSAYDISGYSVSINSFGDIIAISDTNGNGGRVRMYLWDGSEWVQYGQSVVSQINDGHGYSISLNSSGNVLAVGCPLYDGNTGISTDDRGMVKVYTYVETTTTAAPTTTTTTTTTSAPTTTTTTTTMSVNNVSNRLYLWGDNSISQIGNTNLGTQNSPLLIAPSINVVAAGGYHTIGTSGVARTYVGCGDNSQNQLTNSGADAGVGAKTPFRSLSNNLPANIIQVEAGLQHSLYLTLDGTVTARGNNTYGQGFFSSSIVDASGPFIKIAAGNYHNMALNSVGYVYIRGRNNYGQIGSGSASTSDERLLNLNAEYVAAGDYHSAIIRADKILMLCGLNNRGQLGRNNELNTSSFAFLASPYSTKQWNSVSLGTQHSAAIDINGDLYTWGYNLYGQLGLGDTTNRSIPTLVSRINGHAWVEVSAGNGYTLAINANGDVYGWGLNTNYQLGDGTNNNRILPVKINTSGMSGTPVAVKAGPGYHSAALFSDVAVTTTTTTTTLAPIGPNTANFNNCADWNGQDGNVTTVGSNGGPSYYGTFDQTGNIIEWNDLLGTAGSSKVFRNDSYISPEVLSGKTSRVPRSPSEYGGTAIVGFRVASYGNTLNLPYFVNIGDINNTGDITSYGSVSYNYQISQYAVTNCEYVEFLNAIAKTDTYNLSLLAQGQYGIVRSGSNGNYSYSVIDSNMNNKPKVAVNWFDCARYCNWLHNGKPSGLQNSSTTEDGAYTLSASVNGDAVARNANAKYHIPTENEWYKAAYYSPNKNGSGSPGYYTYATQSDTAPTCVSANTTGDGPVASSYVCGATTTTAAPTTTTTAAPATTTTTAPTTTTTTTTTTVRPQIVGSCMSRGSFSKIQLRRATNAQFISANTILASGEPGYATDTRVIKVGDGYTPWSALLPVNISGTIDFPTLLASNNINISSIGSTYVIGATGLALSDHGHDVNDITGLSGVLSNLQPSGNYAPINHQHGIGDITGFNPSGHKHVVADIQGLDLNNLPVASHQHSVGDIYDISYYYSPIGHTHLLNEFDTSPIYRTNIHTIYPDYGYIYISWAQDQQIQRVTLDGNPIVVLKDIGWPGYYDNYSVDVLLEISIPTDATSVDWTGMVNGWYSQPPEPMPVGTHLVLLRAMGDSIDGHYIGSK